MCELNKEIKDLKVGGDLKLVKNPMKLEQLELMKQNPKALPSFPPLIEEDFMPNKDWREKNIDPKEAKRKMKKLEKDALRELRKDTIQVSIQREKENKFKKDMFKKNVVKPGQVKDEI